MSTNLNLTIVDDYATLSHVGADWMTEKIQAKPDATLVLATGDTPMGIYRELAKRYAQGLLDPSRLRVFQLDAYIGLAPEDRRSLFGWMRRSFLDPLDIPHTHVIPLPGESPDPWRACRDYEAAVREAGGFDLSLLGLGPNGHLGFNEPPSPSNAPTRIVHLTPESLVSNARYWGDDAEVPHQALTCGMDLLLAARHTLLVVSGAHKQAILHRTVEGAPTPEVPASYLQQVPNVTVLADRAAWFGEATR